jgi:hypothetical protein
MTDEKFLRVWDKARRRGYWTYTLTRLLIMCSSLAVGYVGACWIGDKPVRLLMPAVMIGMASIVHLSISPSTWRSREERYRQLMSSRTAQAFD